MIGVSSPSPNIVPQVSFGQSHTFVYSASVIILSFFQKRALISSFVIRSHTFDQFYVHKRECACTNECLRELCIQSKKGKYGIIKQSLIHDSS